MSERAPLAPPQSAFEVSRVVAEALRAAVLHAVSVDTATEGANSEAVVTLTGLLPVAAVEAAMAAVPRREREELARQIERHRTRALAALAPCPQLAVPVQGELHLLEPALLTELAEVRLASAPADLPDFARAEDAKPYLIDIERGQLHIDRIGRNTHWT